MILAIAGGFCALGMLLSPWIVNLFAPGFQAGAGQIGARRLAGPHHVSLPVAAGPRRASPGEFVLHSQVRNAGGLRQPRSTYFRFFPDWLWAIGTGPRRSARHVRLRRRIGRNLATRVPVARRMARRILVEAAMESPARGSSPHSRTNGPGADRQCLRPDQRSREHQLCRRPARCIRPCDERPGELARVRLSILHTATGSFRNCHCIGRASAPLAERRSPESRRVPADSFPVDSDDSSALPFRRRSDSRCWARA